MAIAFGSNPILNAQVCGEQPWESLCLAFFRRAAVCIVVADVRITAQIAKFVFFLSGML